MRVTASTLGVILILCAVTACGGTSVGTPGDVDNSGQVPAETVFTTTTSVVADEAPTMTSTDISELSTTSTTIEPTSSTAPPATTTATSTTVAPTTTIESQEPEDHFITYQPNA